MSLCSSLHVTQGVTECMLSRSGSLLMCDDPPKHRMSVKSVQHLGDR